MNIFQIFASVGRTGLDKDSTFPRSCFRYASCMGAVAALACVYYFLFFPRGLFPGQKSCLLGQYSLLFHPRHSSFWCAIAGLLVSCCKSCGTCLMPGLLVWAELKLWRGNGTLQLRTIRVTSTTHMRSHSGSGIVPKKSSMESKKSYFPVNLMIFTLVPQHSCHEWDIFTFLGDCNSFSAWMVLETVISY